MDFLKLQITKTDIKLQMHIQDPVQKIRQPKATLTINQPKGQLEISTSKSVLEIDQSQAWRDMGLLTTKESVEKYVADGRQAVLKGISKTVQEGNQMMLKSGKGQGRSIMPNIAKQNHGPHRVQFNIKFIPSVGSVDIDYKPGELDVNYTPQKPKIDAKVNKPIYEYTQGKISHKVTQRPSIEIDFIR